MKVGFKTKTGTYMHTFYFPLTKCGSSNKWLALDVYLCVWMFVYAYAETKAKLKSIFPKDDFIFRCRSLQYWGIRAKIATHQGTDCFVDYICNNFE